MTLHCKIYANKPPFKIAAAYQVGVTMHLATISVDLKTDLWLNWIRDSITMHLTIVTVDLKTDLWWNWIRFKKKKLQRTIAAAASNPLHTCHSMCCPTEDCGNPSWVLKPRMVNPHHPLCSNKTHAWRILFSLLSIQKPQGDGTCNIKIPQWIKQEILTASLKSP